MSSFLTVLNQVSVLFLLMGVGYALSLGKVINDDCSSRLTTFLCYIVCPAVILYAFQIKFSSDMFRNLIIMAVAAAVIMAASIIIIHIVFNKKTVKNADTRHVLQFSSVYSNCGFMGYPLLQAIAGNTGLFYGSVFNGIFNIFAWTHGISLFSGKVTGKSALKGFLNPNILALFVGIVLFRFSIILPDPFYSTVKYIAQLNTPLSMIIIGTTLTEIPIAKIFLGVPVWVGTFARNVAVPLGVLFGLHFAGLSGNILMCLTILCACPTAGLTVIFAKLSGKDTVFSGKLITLSTLISVISIPALIWLVTFLKY